MNEREMLEMAAKAAGKYAPKKDCPNGWEGIRPETWGCFTMGGEGRTPDYQWNPLTDDGDALRLAVKLRLVVHVWDDGETVSVAKTLPYGYEPPEIDDAWFAEFAYEGERSIEEATRLAITRAAAQIGESMQ